MNFWETVLANTLGGIASVLIVALLGLLMKSQIVAYIKNEAPTWVDTSKLFIKPVLISIASAIIYLIISGFFNIVQ